jgi:hypothetical protein
VVPDFGDPTPLDLSQPGLSPVRRHFELQRSALSLNWIGPYRSAPPTAQPKAQITLRPRASDAEVIDSLVRDHGTNRSKLVTIALTAHLPDA